MRLKNYNTNSLTLSRAILALGFLITLLFNNINELFPSYQLEKIKSLNNDLMFLNIFTWFNNIYIPYYISIIVLVIIILGIYPRITCILHFLITFSVFHSMLIIEGGDQISLVISILLIPICLTDNRYNGWKQNKDLKIPKILLLNTNIIMFLISLQVSLLYFNAGIAKIYAPEWSNGTAVYYWFNDNVFGANEFIANIFGFLFKNDFTVTFINWGVIFFEIILSITLLFSSNYKYILFTLAVFFHFLIMISHGLTTFSLAMTSILILYLWKIDLTINQNFTNIITAYKKI